MRAVWPSPPLLLQDKIKKTNIGKRRNVYNTNIDSNYVYYPTDVIDHVPDSFHRGIDLPPDEFYQIHALSFKHTPSPRPGNPSRPPFRLQSQQFGPQKPFKKPDQDFDCTYSLYGN